MQGVEQNICVLFIWKEEPGSPVNKKELEYAPISIHFNKRYYRFLFQPLHQA